MFILLRLNGDIVIDEDGEKAAVVAFTALNGN